MCSSTANAASRIGTARAEAQPADEHLLAPPQVHGPDQRSDGQRAGDEDQDRGQQQPVADDGVQVERAQRDREPQRDEHHELGHGRELGAERPHVIAVRGGVVADQHPCDEHRQEPRSVGDGANAVDHARRGEGGDRVERPLPAVDQAHHDDPADRAHHDAHEHLPADVGQHEQVGVARVLDGAQHADHERDAHGIVRAGLGGEDGGDAALGGVVAQHREHHSGIGRRERRPDHRGGHPVEAQHVVRGHCHDPRRGEGAEHAEREDRAERAVHLAPAQLHAAVEEDHDERHDPDAGDVVDRDRGGEPRRDLRDDLCAEEEHRGRRHPHARREPAAEDRQNERRRDDQHHLTEVRDLLHYRPPYGNPATSAY